MKPGYKPPFLATLGLILASCTATPTQESAPTEISTPTILPTPSSIIPIEEHL